MNSNDIDRHVTGNWGEDSVAPDFVKASELAYLMPGSDIVIDIADQSDDKAIPVTVKEVKISSGMVTITTEELAYPLLIPQNTMLPLVYEDE